MTIRSHTWQPAALLAGVALLAASAHAAGNATPAYLNTNLSAEIRAADLVHRMTLQEKASQLVNGARAIPRLGVPAYNWWSEALHGVAVNGTTEFPEPIGLAATFDVPGIHEMAHDIGIEGRVVTCAGGARRAARPSFTASTSGRPTSTSSAIRAGAAARRPTARTRSSPARMAVAFVTGMQGDRSALLPRHLHAEAFRGAQRPGADASLRRRRRQQARHGGHLSAGVPRRHRRGSRRIGDVRLQRHQRPAGLRQRIPAAAHAARRLAVPGLRRVGLRRRARYLQRAPLPPEPAAGLGHFARARHGQ